MTDFDTAAAEACDRLAARLDRQLAPAIGIAMVRDEQDIVESFVRHHAGMLAGLIVIDHASCDDTPNILNALISEGLPVAVMGWRNPAAHQSGRMTRLAAAAANRLNAHPIVPLDADEFLVGGAGLDIARQLRAVSADAASVVEWLSYVPTPDDPAHQPDVLKRISHRRAREATRIRKLIVGGDLARHPEFRLDVGAHAAFAGTRKVAGMPAQNELALAHFPVRSVPQLVAKLAVARLTKRLVTERPSDTGVHYEWLHGICPIDLSMDRHALRDAAALYGCSQRVADLELTHDPITLGYDRALRYTTGPADPVQRLFALGNDLVERIRRATSDSEGQVIERRLTLENERLRSALDRIAQVVPELHDPASDPAAAAATIASELHRLRAEVNRLETRPAAARRLWRRLRNAFRGRR